MKIIIKWVAIDGSEWKTEQDATNREILLDKIEIVESILPERISDTNFSNGHGYIQHKREKIKAVRLKLIELADEYVGSFMSTYDLKSYAFGRYLDNNNSTLSQLHSRIVSCIDDSTWREYGQTHYANHLEESDQVQKNT